MISAVALDPQNHMWAYVGTGDRDLLTTNGTSYSSTLTLDTPIPSAVCGTGAYASETYYNRIYGMRLDRKVATRPNNEGDLTNVTLAGNDGFVGRAADPSAFGWFLILRPAEKVNNPADVFNKVVYFTSYEPACNAATINASNACTISSGTGRLYAMDYLKGTPALALGGGAVSGSSFTGSGGIALSSADTPLNRWALACPPPRKFQWERATGMLRRRSSLRRATSRPLLRSLPRHRAPSARASCRSKSHRRCISCCAHWVRITRRTPCLLSHLHSPTCTASGLIILRSSCPKKPCNDTNLHANRERPNHRACLALGERSGRGE